MLTHRRTGQTSGSKKEDGKKQTQSEKARTGEGTRGKVARTRRARRARTRMTVVDGVLFWFEGSDAN